MLRAGKAKRVQSLWSLSVASFGDYRRKEEEENTGMWPISLMPERNPALNPHHVLFCF